MLGPEADAWALVLLMVSGVTDWLDGWLARRLGQSSRLGEILDPVADRLYILAVVVGLALREIIPWWVAIILPLRDLLLWGLVPFLRTRGYSALPVHFLGKAATFNLLYAFPLLLLGDGTGMVASLADVFGWAFAIWGIGLYWWAGVLYAYQVYKLMQDRDNRVGIAAVTDLYEHEFGREYDTVDRVTMPLLAADHDPGARRGLRPRRPPAPQARSAGERKGVSWWMWLAVTVVVGVLVAVAGRQTSLAAVDNQSSRTTLISRIDAEREVLAETQTRVGRLEASIAELQSRGRSAGRRLQAEDARGAAPDPDPHRLRAGHRPRRAVPRRQPRRGRPRRGRARRGPRAPGQRPLDRRRRGDRDQRPAPDHAHLHPEQRAGDQRQLATAAAAVRHRGHRRPAHPPGALHGVAERRALQRPRRSAGIRVRPAE